MEGTAMPSYSPKLYMQWLDKQPQIFYDRGIMILHQQ
jgi:hypothetical protein